MEEQNNVLTAKWTATQPWRGILALIITMSIALIITTMFKMETFMGIFTIFAISMVPIEVIIGLGWGNNYPPTGNLPQPWRGLALIVFMAIIGTLTCFLVMKWIGNGAAHPLTNVYIISVVCLTFWAVIGFGMWPFHNMSPPAKGFLTLIFVFLIMWLGLKLFNFSMLSFPTGVNPADPAGGVPFYAKGGPLAVFAGIAPKGPFGWESALAVWFWFLVFLFSFVLLGMWPINKSPSLMKQPAMGITLFVICGILAVISFIIGVTSMKIEPVRFLLHGVCYLFGVLMIMTMFEMWPGRTLKSPVAGGFVNIILAIILAVIGFYVIHAFCNWHFGEAMKYPFNWMTVANVMLAITFPIWAAFSGFFNYWPLPPSPPPPDSE